MTFMYIVGHTQENKFYAVPIEHGEQYLYITAFGSVELNPSNRSLKNRIILSLHPPHLSIEFDPVVRCFVNGIKKSEQCRLVDGDELMIQDIPLKIIADIKSILASTHKNTLFVTSHTIPLLEQNVRHHPKSMFDGSQEISKTLLSHLEMILAAKSKTQWKEHLFKALCKIFPFERIYLFLFNANKQQFLLFDTYFKHPQTEPTVALLSQTLVNYVLKTKRAVFSKDFLSDPRFKDSESLMNSALSTLVCIPLLSDEHITGLIYGDTNYVLQEHDRIALEELIMICRQATIVLENFDLHTQVQEKNERISENFKVQFPFVGKSEVIQNTLHLVKRVAPTNMNILITGETGTGKELIAHMIHQCSHRNHHPLEIVNCGAIPEHLWESEMFGFEKGAFTGAHAQKKGRFEIPDGGTLFLDEIGEMPLVMQSKLLRFLQDQIIQRIGSHKTLKVNVRIIAATNRDLEKEVQKGTFREDLYYRLNVMRIEIPPLRERKTDIDALIAFFIERFCDELHRPALEVTKEALDILKSYSWPGNIREMKNIIERAIVISDSHSLTPDHIHLQHSMDTMVSLTASHDRHLNYKLALDDFEASFLKNLLIKAKGNVTQAAELAGLDRSHLHQKLKKHGLNSAHFK